MTDFSHILLTRPRPDSRDLAGLIKPLGLQPVVLPAFTYHSLDARKEQPESFAELEAAGSGLLVFTSPRAVEHGLKQIAPENIARMNVAAIGPASARALSRAGIRVDVVPHNGYTSEDLLATLPTAMIDFSPGVSRAWIVAAPGGRKKLQKGLEKLGWLAAILFVYRSRAAELDREALDALQDADSVLSVWTSSNSMKALSQRIPPAAWFQLCRGEWLVVSGRLARLARAYGPSRIHLAAGPGNDAIATAVRAIINEK